MSEEKNQASESHKTLMQRFSRFSSATLLSRVLGYVRDASVAYIFGGEAVTDTFYTAFRVSNLMRRLFGEGALSSSFIPVFSKSLKTDSREETQNFLNALFSSLAVILLIVTVLGMLFAPQLTRLIAPGFSVHPEKFETTVMLTRWTFPFFYFICIAAMVSGVLNSLKHFFLPAFAPAMLSVAEIVYLLLFIPVIAHATGGLSVNQQLVGLSISVVVGGMGHLLIQIPTLHREGFRLKFQKNWKHPNSMKVVSLMVPAMIGLSVDQVNAFVDTICATFLVHGSVTALYNSNRLMQLPLALFGVAMANVSLPSLSDHSTEKDFEKFEQTIHQALRLILFTVMPAAIGLILLARPITALLFEHGQFGSFATALTASALMGYCLGLVAYSTVKVLANGFYALHEPQVAVRTAIYCMLLNILLNILLMKPFGVKGLAVSTSICSWVNAAVLYMMIRRRIKAHHPESDEESKLAVSFFKTGGACLGMFGFIAAVKSMMVGMAAHWIVIVGIGGGLMVFLTLATIFRMEEQRTIFEMVGLPTEFLEDD